jgi:hypothetical protein
VGRKEGRNGTDPDGSDSDALLVGLSPAQQPVVCSWHAWVGPPVAPHPFFWRMHFENIFFLKNISSCFLNIVDFNI